MHKSCVTATYVCVINFICSTSVGFYFHVPEQHITPPIVSVFHQNPEVKKRRTFKKFTYRGVDLDQLLDMGDDQLKQLFNARQRRRIERGHKRKHMNLLRRLRKAKKEAPPMEKPEAVKTHLRDMIIVPEMTGSIVGVYNGKSFTGVEIKVR